MMRLYAQFTCMPILDQCDMCDDFAWTFAQRLTLLICYAQSRCFGHFDETSNSSSEIWVCSVFILDAAPTQRLSWKSSRQHHVTLALLLQSSATIGLMEALERSVWPKRLLLLRGHTPTFAFSMISRLAIVLIR